MHLVVWHMHGVVIIAVSAQAPRWAGDQAVRLHAAIPGNSREEKLSDRSRKNKRNKKWWKSYENATKILWKCDENLMEM